MNWKKAAIVYDSCNKRAKNASGEVKAFLMDNGIEPTCCAYNGVPPKTETKRNFDLAVSIGGDGTFLHCAGLFVKKPIPIFPINAGSLGFITEVSLDEWRNGLTEILSGNAKISKRLMLKVRLIRGNKEIGSYVSINDAVISSRGKARLIALDLSVQGKSLGISKGDGLILSTSTGSTAYSLAAGGPIVYPEMDGFVITHICPFSLSHRPLVISGDSEVDVVVRSDQRTTLALTIDGQKVVSLEEGDQLLIGRNDKKLKVFMSGKRHFYEVLKMKLGWSGGVHA